MPFITQKKNIILKNIFIQSCNIDFLKLGNFYYDLLLLNRKPQNHKNKNVKQKSLVFQANTFPKIQPPPLRAKIVIPQGAVLDKFVSPQQKRETLRRLPWHASRGQCLLCKYIKNALSYINEMSRNDSSRSFEQPLLHTFMICWYVYVRIVYQILEPSFHSA